MGDDNSWLHAYQTNVPDAWFVTIHGATTAMTPYTVEFYWPINHPLLVPSKMVLMTIAAYADLSHRASLTSTDSGAK